jgi:hypothetical protein
MLLLGFNDRVASRIGLAKLLLVGPCSPNAEAQQKVARTRVVQIFMANTQRLG